MKTFAAILWTVFTAGGISGTIHCEDEWPMVMVLVISVVLLAAGVMYFQAKDIINKYFK
jgi:hypothetical protein